MESDSVHKNKKQDGTGLAGNEEVIKNYLVAKKSLLGIYLMFLICSSPTFDLNNFWKETSRII